MSKLITSFQFANGKLLKNLINMVKDVVNDIQFLVVNSRIQILNMNPSEDVLIDVIIQPSKLESFELNREKIIFCIDSSILYKILNYCENKKPVLFYINEDDFYEGIVNFVNIKIDGNVSKIKTIENQMEIDCEKLDYDIELQVKTKVFLKNIRMMVNNAESIKLDFNKKQLKMQNSNESVDIENVVENEIVLLKNNDCYVEEFLSKNMKILLKLCFFSEYLVLCFLKNSPLLIEINLFDFGNISLYFKSNDIEKDD